MRRTHEGLSLLRLSLHPHFLRKSEKRQLVSTSKIWFLRTSLLRISSGNNESVHLRCSIKFIWWKIFAKSLETGHFWIINASFKISKTNSAEVKSGFPFSKVRNKNFLVANFWQYLSLKNTKSNRLNIKSDHEKLKRSSWKWLFSISGAFRRNSRIWIA